MTKLSLDTLLELEVRGWESLTKSKGGDFYGEIMTTDAVMILVNGMILDYEMIISSLNDSELWDFYEITQPRLLNITEDTATLIYSAKASRKNDIEPFHAIMASTYTLVESEIKLALYQQTTVTHS